MSKPRKPASSGGARNCDICGCTVTDGNNGWQTHVAGIRHRRNVASCRIFGEPGHPVVSAFEHVDTPPPAGYRGKDQVLLAAGQSPSTPTSVTTASGTPSTVATAAPVPTVGGTRSTVPPEPTRIQTSRQLELQFQLRKHLADLSGTSDTSRRAVARFSLDNLRGAWTVVQAQIATQIQEAAAAAAAVAQTAATESQQQQQQQVKQHRDHSQQQQQRSRQQAVQTASKQYQVQLSLHEAAEIACLAVVLPDAVHSLKLTVPYQSYGPAAAATIAAVACFMASLAHHHHLKHLELAFKCDQFSDIVGQGGNALDMSHGLWAKVVGITADAMKVNCGLLELVLTSYPEQFSPDGLAALQTASVKSRQHLRTTLLLGTHPRLGAASLLHRLPHEVLVMVVEAAVPRPCRLLLQLPHELLTNSSCCCCSSSSSESSSGSESGSSSSSGGSSEDDD